MKYFSNSLPPEVARKLPLDDKRRLGIITYEEAQAALAAREEKELQKQLAGLFAIHGVIANRSAMHKRKTDMIGWPDFVMTIFEKGVAMEAKRPGEKLDPDQIKVRDRMIAPPNCWRYYVIHTVAEAVEVLRELKVIK